VRSYQKINTSTISKGKSDMIVIGVEEGKTQKFIQIPFVFN
jgi:hypothetical protein